MAPITSFIRWAGGKSWLVPFVRKLTEELEFNDYFEPFMGGASIFFSMELHHMSYLSDINKELVDTFCAVRDDPHKIISYLRNYKSDESSYYEIRASVPIDKYESAARFLYLNANSFNGLYRVNKQGKYNVPYGKKEAAVNCERLTEISKKLAGVDIQCQDFDKIRGHIHKGDLIFLDPPYTVSHKDNGFIQYNKKLFSLEDQQRLAELIEHINDQNAYYILTNAAHDTIKDIFQNSDRIITLERNSLIGGKNSYRGKVKEYIFTNITERK
jgi:DNA adenine methylase